MTLTVCSAAGGHRSIRGIKTLRLSKIMQNGNSKRIAQKSEPRRTPMFRAQKDEEELRKETEKKQ